MIEVFAGLFCSLMGGAGMWFALRWTIIEDLRARCMWQESVIHEANAAAWCDEQKIAQLRAQLDLLKGGVE